VRPKAERNVNGEPKFHELEPHSRMAQAGGRGSAGGLNGERWSQLQTPLRGCSLLTGYRARRALFWPLG
jgi:hypothetical protein